MATEGRVEVHVVDEQHDHHVDAGRWAALAAATLEAEGVRGPAEANLLFVGPEAMEHLNRRHMGAEGPTDVLSFPIDGGSGEEAGGLSLVGDIVLCPAVAESNAPGHAGGYDDEIALLIVHGCLHLLGYDHATDSDRDRMWSRERELIAAHHGPVAGDPWSVS